MTRIGALIAALSMASACGGSGVPTAPSAPSPGTGLALMCSAPTLLAGDLVVCRVTAASVNVSTAAVWTSSDPNIATSQGVGLFMGKSEGQATLTATYSDQSASAPLTVHLQDVLRATAAAYQGSFKVGTTVTLWLQGFYGVASAGSGTLTLVITDQDRCDRPHKRTADSSARWRPVPHLDHLHAPVRHHACMSGGGPSNRFDNVDSGSGRLACAVL